MASLEDRRREMQRRADRGDAYARGWLEGIQEYRDSLESRSRVGRRSGVPEDIRALMVTMRDAGYSLRQIADWLEASGIPASYGGATWRASSVAAVLRARA